jgi:hypothetical protein
MTRSTKAVTAQFAGNEFEKYPALAREIERMASTGITGSLIEWQRFLDALNVALTKADKAKPFYGAQCRLYPNCTGGCGLGCTHEIETAALAKTGAA